MAPAVLTSLSANRDNPLLRATETFLKPGQTTGPVHDWIKEAVAEGEAFMQADPAWDTVDRNMDYIMGRQRALQITELRPAYVSHAVLNETKRTRKRHISALTDLKPVYAYRTPNPNFQKQSLLLNQLTVVHWINTFADLALADAADYAFVAGSGDIVCEYDPYYGPMGDIVMSARDPRDTIPIRPSRDGSVQNWFGMIIREAHSLNVLKQMYPNHPALLQQSASPWGGGVFTKWKRALNRIMGSGSTSTLSGLTKVHSGPATLTGNEVILYRCYVNDASVNTTAHNVLMGPAGVSWSYMVPPGGRLYPRKRLIIATEAGILWDGPNTYWHGMFPCARLQLDHVPWSFFGVPIVDSNLPIQDAINDLLNTMLDDIRQKKRPPLAGNARVSEPKLKQFDPLKPNARIRTEEQVGTGLQVVEIPDLPPYTLELWQALRTAFHEATGDSTLDALQQAAANQSFDPEQIEAFMNALSPEMKLEGRRVEVGLRELAEMQKANIFQFYDQKKRMAVLGDAGMTLADFDYDPGNLIPAMAPTDSGYHPELDSNRDQKDRAQFFLQLFTFYVTPNSLLALNAKSEQLKYVQLARAGLCDRWTLWEKLEIPNGGSPPLMLLPSDEQGTPPDPALMEAVAAGLVPNMSIDPNTGQLLTLRVPTTITERLQAEMQLFGGGMTVGPAGSSASSGNPTQGGGGGMGGAREGAGRKATAQKSPSIERQPIPGGGERIKMSESRR